MEYRLILIIILIGLFCVQPIYAEQPPKENSSAFLQITDMYVFDTNGTFDRKSIVFLTHNDKENDKNLVFSQFFPKVEDEKHVVLSNITYSFYWNWCLNQTIVREPKDDFKSGETISEIISLEYGKNAHYEREYKGYINPKEVNLGLNLELVRENPKCEQMDCGDYNLVYFNRIIKIKKDKLLGLMELNIKEMFPQPKIIYDDGDYRTFVWEDFPLDMGDLKQTYIRFGYYYKSPKWIIWTIISIFITWYVTRYYSKKDLNKEKIRKFLDNPTLIKGVGDVTAKNIKEYFKPQNENE